MSVSGAIFLATENYAALIAAALIGTINVTGSETEVLLSIKQALLPRAIAEPNKRNTVFALYDMAGAFAMSAGILVSGLPSTLRQSGMSPVESIKPLFATYTVLGIAIIAIYFMLSKKVNATTVATQPLKQMLSPKSRRIVGRLSGLFAVDSFAGGFVI